MRTFSLIALILLFGAAFFSCKKGEKGEEIPFIEIWRFSELCGEERYEKQDRVISSQYEWENLLIDVDFESCIRWPGGAPWDFLSKMKNDFDVYQRIVVIDELRGPMGRGFEITKITDYAEKVVVTVTETLPKGGMDYGTAQHYQIVKMPATTKKIEFKHIYKTK